MMMLGVSEGLRVCVEPGAVDVYILFWWFLWGWGWAIYVICNVRVFYENPFFFRCFVVPRVMFLGFLVMFLPLLNHVNLGLCLHLLGSV